MNLIHLKIIQKIRLIEINLSALFYNGKFFLLNHNDPIKYVINDIDNKIIVSIIQILVPDVIDVLSHNVIIVKYLKLDNISIEGLRPPNIAIIDIKIKNTDIIPDEPIEYLDLLNIPLNIKQIPDKANTVA